jgi:hypothetical protein
MALNRSHLLQIKRMFNGGIAMGPKKSLRLQGAVLVAGMGVLALGILVASRQPQPVMTTAAMEQDLEQTGTSTTAARRARARQAENAVNTAVVTSRASDAPAQAADNGIVTISGCLEQDDDVFRLKNTEGANAPKARSWKSGFLKKGSAKVDIVDVSNRLRLKSHVGKRVTVTGQLHEKELLANSVRRLAASCE